MYEIEMNGTPIKIWAKAVDPHAYKEIYNLSTMPFVYHHLAFMPYVHGGKGMPIGGVLATENVVIPNAVGVDIGCGMCAVRSTCLRPARLGHSEEATTSSSSRRTGRERSG